jgi:hypothetical protein
MHENKIMTIFQVSPEKKNSPNLRATIEVKEQQECTLISFSCRQLSK